MCLPVAYYRVCICGRLFKECVMRVCVSVAVFMACKDVEVAMGCRVVCRPALQHHHPATQTHTKHKRAVQSQSLFHI